MHYKSKWLTKAQLARIERMDDLPLGTLQADERTEGAFVSNALNKIPDPRLRDRADSAIRTYCELDSLHLS